MTAINATVSELTGVRLALSLPVADLNLYAAGVHPRDCGDTRGFPSDEHSLLNYNVSVSSSESQQQQMADTNNWLDLSVEVRKVASDADWESEADCHAHFLAGHAPLSLLKEEGQDQLDVLLGNPNLHNSSGCDLLEKDGHVLHSEGSSCSSTAALSSGKKKRPKAAAAAVDASSPSRQAQQPPQPCSMCTKVFTSTSALTKHRLTHSDERRFACHLCGKAFKRQDHLNGHLITHREKKPFECTINGCGKSYCDARSLRRHQDNHHAPSSNSSSNQSPAPETTAKAAIFTDLSCSINYPSSNGSSFIEPSPEYSAALDPWNGAAATQQDAAAAAASFTDITTDIITDAAAVNWGSFTAESPPQQHQQQQQARKPKVKTEKAKAKKAKSKAKKSDPNEGLTTQQLELIQQIMRQTQEQHRLQQEEQQQQHQQQQQQQQPKNKKTNIKQKTVGSGQNSDNNCLPDCGRPVECNVCQRRFKNTPALNGHMRLHGGFLKKDAECKKPDKKDPNTPPLQTASVSVRALIEEKIIQRRNMAAGGAAGTPTGTRSSTGCAGMESQADKAGNDEEIVAKEEGHHDVKMEDVNQVQQVAEDSYFEGSFLALSPASLHRALEGEEAEVGAPVSSSTEGSSSVTEAQQDHFFSTSSSSSSALSDVSLLDDAVFHQVSAAAASALLSDISSLDLQSYIDGAQPAGQSSVYTDCLSQYLQSSTYEQSSFVQQPQYNFNDSAAQYQQQQGFNFDPSPIPSTPLSSLCSPQYIAEQFQAAAAQFDCSSQQHSMLLPTPSPYTPSPSPVSPAVSMTTAPLPPAFQQHSGSYYPSSFSSDLQAQNSLFLMECSSQVPYGMDVGGLATPQWDHSSFSGCAEQQQQHSETIPVSVEETPAPKAKPNKKRSADPKAAGLKLTLIKSPKQQPEAAERRKFAEKSRTDEFDEILGLPKGSLFISSLKDGSHFVPAPMLNPNRPGTGLFKNLVTEGKPRFPPAKPRINLGKDFQCAALPRCKKEGSSCKETEAAEMLWDPLLDSSQLDKLLAWTRSAATPVKKKSTEEIMQVFTLYRGDVRAAQQAMLKETSAEQPAWNADTVQLFGEALKQYGKDFGRIAQSIPSATKAECAQFYYLWKQLYREEYQQLKGIWRRAGKTSSQAKEIFMEGLEAAVLGGGAAATAASAATAALVPSEFGDCPAAVSMSRQRKSSGRHHSNLSSSSSTTTATTVTTPNPAVRHTEASPARVSSAAASSRPPSCASVEQAVDKLYPCSICNKVYEKVKSRSAHMKTHKTNSNALSRTNQQPSKKIKYQSPSPSHSSTSLPSPFFSSSSSSSGSSTRTTF